MTILLCGIGNIERGDDGFGPYIVEKLAALKRIKTLHCGLYIENYLNTIVESKPDLIIMLDAIHHKRAGLCLLRNEELMRDQALSISTHSMPISALYEFLRAESHADVWLLGAQIQSYQRFTPSLRAMADDLVHMFTSLDNEENIDIINVYENLSSILR